MRRSTRAPGGVASIRRLLGLLLIGGLVLVMAACGQATSTATPTGTRQPTTGTGTSEPPATEPPATEPGSTTPTDAPTTTPDSATPEPSATEPTATPPGDGIGSAAVCSGSDENRDFFASMAAAVDWTVYCPVLDGGWFVDDGRYRLAGGGWLEISYDGPGEARLILRQGAFCNTTDGCLGTGRDTGSAAFGPETGVMIARDDGSLAVAVANGEPISWLLVVNGLDESTAREIAADLHPITD